ncbi:MAG TPA: hypothetical protein VJL29_08980 [Thermoguttaceae bacterium]|nr:hypothetical protein [Thermoguttaceae bacterium]
MRDIDFLPDGYRQQHSGHNVRLWRVVVVAAFLLMLSAASLVQYYRLCRVRGRLEQFTAQYSAAQAQNAQLARLQSELTGATADADLRTYLRHPWPRTQLLAAILAPLPDSVTLKQLEIKVEGETRRRQSVQDARRESTDGQAMPKLPAQQDLALFREQRDKAGVSAVLSGRASDLPALHRYVEEVGRNSLVELAELDSLESVTGAENDVPEGTMSFVVVVDFRSGYGQPNGPTGFTRVARHETKSPAGGKSP